MSSSHIVRVPCYPGRPAGPRRGPAPDPRSLPHPQEPGHVLHRNPIDLFSRKRCEEVGSIPSMNLMRCKRLILRFLMSAAHSGMTPPQYLNGIPLLIA